MINQEDKQKINEKITAIETQSAGELVAVICQQSDDYLYIPTLWAALVALVAPTLWLWFDQVFSVGLTVTIQLVVFAVLALIFRWRPLKMWLVPETVQTQRASRHAHQLFLLEGLHLTENHVGVMLFVSQAEKYVEIIADKALDGIVSQEQWQAIIDQFILHLQQGDVAKGYHTAIDACGELLIQHFPAKGEKSVNELTNHLVEI